MSEHLNHSLLEYARMMHLTADLPRFLWAKSVQHMTWLKNCMLSMAKHHLRCCTSKNLTSKTYLSGGPTYLSFAKGTTNSMKDWMKAAGLDIVWTPRATTSTGWENATCHFSGMLFSMQLCQFNTMVWSRGSSTYLISTKPPLRTLLQLALHLHPMSSL